MVQLDLWTYWSGIVYLVWFLPEDLWQYQDNRELRIDTMWAIIYPPKMFDINTCSAL